VRVLTDYVKALTEMILKRKINIDGKKEETLKNIQM
jgi:hypothetical protein